MIDISNALPRGTILQGLKNKYRIQHVLGQGSFGITYLATTEMQVSGPMGSFTAKVQVAVKEFFMKDLNGREGTEVTSSSQGGLFTDYKKKFQREAVNLSKLHHPYIVKVLESFEANGTAYYVMEYLEGGSLDAYIEQQGGLPETEALRITRQIGDALEFMHQHRMLHLDVKPGNVMLRPTGEVVLIDFGLSKQFDKNGKPESSTTIGGGTPGYAPLEQAKYQRGDGLPVTMDVYALGGTLYKMLTGEQPPEASDVLNDGLPTFVLERRGITARTIASIVRAMSPLHRNRFQDIRAFMEALRGSGASQSEDPTVITGAEPSHRNRASRSSNSARSHSKPINWKKVAYIFLGVVGVVMSFFLSFFLLWATDNYLFLAIAPLALFFLGKSLQLQNDSPVIGEIVKTKTEQTSFRKKMKRFALWIFDVDNASMRNPVTDFVVCVFHCLILALWVYTFIWWISLFSESVIDFGMASCTIGVLSLLFLASRMVLKWNQTGFYSMVFLSISILLVIILGVEDGQAWLLPSFITFFFLFFYYMVLQLPKKGKSAWHLCKVSPKWIKTTSVICVSLFSIFILLAPYCVAYSMGGKKHLFEMGVRGIKAQFRASVAYDLACDISFGGKFATDLTIADDFFKKAVHNSAPDHYIGYISHLIMTDRFPEAQSVYYDACENCKNFDVDLFRLAESYPLNEEYRIAYDNYIYLIQEH